MKIKNLVFCGFMGSLLTIGAASAAITEADKKTLATAAYVKEGVNYAIENAGTKVSGSDYITKTAGTNGAYSLSAKIAEFGEDGAIAEGKDGLVLGSQLKTQIDKVTGDASTLSGRVGTLETTVGKAAEGSNPATGLVKDVADLKAKDTTIENTLGTGFGTGTNETVTAKLAAETSARTSGDATTLASAKAYTDALANGAVKDNTDAITKLNGDKNTAGSVDYKIEAAKTALSGDISGLTTRMDTAEGKITTLNGGADTTGSVANTVKTTAAGATYNNETSKLTATTIQGAIDEVEGRLDTAESEIDTLQSGKQDKLTAGAGIDITNNTVSVKGTGTGAYYFNGTSWENLPITSGTFSM